ncbi:MAG: hypothetical protein J6B79_06890 [Clostridia bacterium]|nr:hypothetical protein [Clostridia bacterium]
MFREKYQAVLAEYEKFWERKNFTRPILNITYPLPNTTPYRAPINPEEKYIRVEYRYNQFKHTVASTGYLAEGVPMCFTNFGPGCLAAAIGGNFVLSDRTIWFDTKQIITDWENPPTISFNPNSELWSKIIEAQRLYASDPEIHFSITDIGGIMDVVAALRGTENLLYDLYDYPNEVKAFTKEVKAQWFKAFDQQLSTVRDANQPYNNWMNIPSSKPWYPIQCDFCYMISPNQFEEFILPDLTDQMNYMERSIYHLDGVGELPHVDMLLDVPSLTGIQWTSGANQAPLWDEKWLPLYKKIQDKKKNIVLLGGISEHDLEGAERLIKSLDPTGFYISFGCSSKEKAEEILEKITLWSR